MAECECLPKCPFFHDKVPNMPAMSEMLKAKYCLGDNAHCARHIVFERAGRENVPADLFPGELDRVDAILRDATPAGVCRS